MVTAPLNTLVSALRGRSITNAWDVVVSYNLAKMQTVLNDLWGGKQVGAIPIDPKPVPGKIVNSYLMQLHKPALKFIAEEGPAMARLTMGLSGISYLDQDKDKPLPIDLGTFVIDIDVPLVSIPGGPGMSGDGKLAESSNTLKTFGENKPAEYNIVFHFSSVSEKKWNLRTLDAEKVTNQDTSIDMLLVSNELQRWFRENVRSIDYILAQIKEDEIPAATAGDVILKPKSFVFAINGTGADAVLSLYIQTKESGFGPGDTNPSFSLPDQDGMAIRLVPAGYDVSVVIRHEVMRDLFFVSNINRILGAGATYDVRDASEDGFKFAIRSNQYYEQKINDRELFQSYVGGGKLHGNFLEHPFIFRVQNNSAWWTLDWSDKVNWQLNNHFGGKPCLGSFDVHTWADSTTQNIASSDRNLSSFKWSFLPASQFHITMTPTGNPDPWSNWPVWKKFLYGPPNYDWSMDLPEQVSTYKPNLNEINISFNGLDFFLTKNLFAKPSDPNVITIDSGVGLLTPHEALLVGTIGPLKRD
ncbi:hypothetical protein F4678DRAFT_482796 [Xylaria arbuscula]|nr:hypothetical protein F4678DRAFT_482796 [Xylaria arbuscula]